MNDINLKHLADPTVRAAFIKQKLAERGLVQVETTPTPEQRICTAAMQIFNEVTNTTLRPLLKSLAKPTDYSPAGTQQLLVDSFKTKFTTFSKEELVILLAIMHAEELESQAAQMAHAGLVGPDMDKKIWPSGQGLASYC